MGGKHDGISRLQRDHGLVAHRWGWSGDNGGDDTHRHTDLPELPFLLQDSHSLHAPDGLGHPLRGKYILSGLVLHVSEARLADRHLRQHGGLPGKGLGNGLHNAVQLGLGKRRQLLLRNLRFFRQLPGLLPGGQIFIQFHISSIDK